jgi:hypothetical protein
MTACYTVAIRRAGIDGLHAAAIAAVVSLLFYLPIYLVLFEDDLFTKPAADLVFQALYQGVLTAAISLALYDLDMLISQAFFGQCDPSYPDIDAVTKPMKDECHLSCSRRPYRLLRPPGRSGLGGSSSRSGRKNTSESSTSNLNPRDTTPMAMCPWCGKSPGSGCLHPLECDNLMKS